MRKKIIIIGVVLVVLVGAFAVVLLNLEGLVNRNKDFLLSRAESTLGREISVGEIGITLWGGIGVRLQDFSLADDPAFSPQPFIEAKDLQVNLKLLPLLKKEFEVKRVILHDPVIRVIRDESGNLNINTFDAGEGTAKTEADAGVGAAAPLAISLVNIDGGELHYKDKATGLDLQITQIESHVEDLDFDRPVSLTMRAAVLSDRKNFELGGTFGPVGADGDASNLPVDAEVTLEAIEIARIMDLLPKAGDTVPPGLDLNGPVTITAKASGTLPDIPFSVEIDATALSLIMPERFEKPADVPLRLTADAEYKGDRILIRGTKLVLASLEALIDGEYLLGDSPAIDLQVKANRTSLAGWDTMLPTLKPYQISGDIEFEGRIRGEVKNLKPGEMSGIEGAGRISRATMSLPQLPKPLTDIEATFAVAGEQLTIQNTTLRAGDSQIQGSAIVERLEPFTVAYDAKSPSLSLNDIKAPNPAAKKPEVMRDVVARGRMVTDTEFNEGAVTSSSGSLANYDYQNLKADYVIEGKQARLDDINVQTLGGALTGSGTVTFDEQSPEFDFNTQSRDLNLVETVDALPMFTREHLRGRANLDLKISGQGKDWANIQKTITGDGFAEMFKGEIVDVNVFDSILSALTDATGVSNWISQAVKNKYPKVFGSKDTYFEDLKSTFVIEDGKLLARNLRLDANDYVMVGKGAIDFNRGLDLRVTLLMSHALTADVVNDVKEAKYLKNDSGQIEIPFVLSGTLPRVTAKPESNYLNQVVQKALTQQGLDLFNKKGIKDILNFGNKKKGAPADSSGP